jgi:hypothetical protein
MSSRRTTSISASSLKIAFPVGNLTMKNEITLKKSRTVSSGGLKQRRLFVQKVLLTLRNWLIIGVISSDVVFSTCPLNKSNNTDNMTNRVIKHMIDVRI